MIDGLTLDQMRVFVTVAETGSFRAAAGRLRRVQSAISHAIANLESQLGTALFDRSAKLPVLTPAGTILLAEVRAILLRTDALRTKARRWGEGLERSLTVAVDPLFPPLDLAQALRTMNRTCPEVAVRLWPAPLGAGIDALVRRGCDLAITGAEFDDPLVERCALPTVSPFVAVAAAGHPLAGAGGPIEALDVADHIQIVVEDPSPVTEGRTFGVLSPSVWKVGDLIAKRALILTGIGWGNLPFWMVAEDLGAGRLVRLPLAGTGPSGEIPIRTFAAWRVDTPPGPAARVMLNALMERQG